eukprot:269939_1
MDAFVKLLSTQGILNPSDAKELIKLLLTDDSKELEELINVLKAFRSYKELFDDEKQPDAEFDGSNINDKIKEFQTSIRKIIKQMMQLAYKNVPNKSNDKISDKQMILKLIENHNLLNPDIVHYIHNYILYDIHDENQSDRYDGLSIQNIIELLQIKSKDILNKNKYYTKIIKKYLGIKNNDDDKINIFQFGPKNPFRYWEYFKDNPIRYNK